MSTSSSEGRLLDKAPPDAFEPMIPGNSAKMNSRATPRSLTPDLALRPALVLREILLDRSFRPPGVVAEWFQEEVWWYSHSGDKTARLGLRSGCMPDS